MAGFVQLCVEMPEADFVFKCLEPFYADTEYSRC